MLQPRWMRRSIFHVVTLMAGGAALMHAADLPVKHVVLYKHGVGFFEREGVAAAGEEVRLDFRTSDMNDILKSLTVTDLSGGRITSVRYDSNETLEQRLSRFPFKLQDSELLSAFLDRLKGAQTELKAQERTVKGSILGARAIQTAAENEKRLVREQITLLLESGDLVTYDLANVNSIHFQDPGLQEQLKQYLQAYRKSEAPDKRSIYIDAAGNDSRHLRASYISPVPIWKSSYRLTLHEPESTLEGWAIIDNTTDEDWNNVKLSVVSGRPISFISLLDTPRYGNRKVAELPEDRAAGPQVYAGSVEAARQFVSNQLSAPRVQAKQVTGAVGGVPEAAPPPLSGEALSSVQGATGATMGELFEYSFAGPVTIKKNQSAMMPFLQDKVAARKLLIYTDRDGEHPVNAAELTNKTEKTLDGGPITVYDDGSYAGEALFETLKAGDKRLVGYAVDYGTRVTKAFDSGTQNVREIHVKNGSLEIKYATHQIRTYTVRNVDAKSKTLIVEQDGASQYTVLSPKPMERTANAYRFEVKLAANASQTLKVDEEQTTFTENAVAGETPDSLLAIVQNKQLPERARLQLAEIADLKKQQVAAFQATEENKAQQTDLTNEQTRLRQNIDSLNRVNGQEEPVRKYSAQLGENETKLAALGDVSRNLSAQRAALSDKLRNAIEKLEF